MIYLIGDSQIRSFCFIKEIVPLFLGPSKANNFNNIKNTERTVNKISGLISNLNRDDKVIVFLGSGHRHSTFFETPSDENLSELLSLFEQGMNAIADACPCRVELLTPVPPTKIFDDLYEPWARFEQGLLELFAGSERIKIHSFAKQLNVNGPLDGDSIFDEIHVSGSTALAVTKGMLAKEIGMEAWRYCETIKGTRKGSSAKIVGDIPYFDLDISSYETLNFSIHHQDSLAVEFLIGQIAALCKTENKNRFVVIEEGEGFVTRCLLTHLPNSSITSIYRNANTMKKALAVNNICGVSPEIYLIEDSELKLDADSIFIVDGFEKLRDEYKKIIIAAIKNDTQSFLISKIPEKDSVFASRASGGMPTSLSNTETISEKQLIALNTTSEVAIKAKPFWHALVHLLPIYLGKIRRRLT